jgi:hypothetical protein
MNRFATRALLVIASIVFAQVTHAQVFRSYLSINGSDANPCSVAAPCRLLPAALAAVADGGEIWILDSANFNSGMVTIAKNVAISSVPGQIGSVVAVNGGSAITITGAVTVTFRNMAITSNAANPGDTGIAVAAGATLVVDSCTVSNLPNSGISGPSGAVIHVRNSTIRGGGAWGIAVGGGSTLDVTRSALIGNNGAGVMAESASNSTTTVSVTDSTVSGNGPGTSGTGIYASSNAAQAKVNVYVTRSAIARNGIGLLAVSATGSAASIAISNSIVSGNDAGFMHYGAGTTTIKTLGNNHIADNGANTGALTPLAAQ